MNPYYNLDRSSKSAVDGTHRTLVGGYWEEIGDLYMDIISEHEITPDKRVLDIGCGCLRLGVRLVDYLDQQNYYGTDISTSLLDAGYNIELGKLGLKDKLPRKQLVTEEDFSFKQFDQPFDCAIDSSVFTHLPAEKLAQCLEHLAPKMKTGGKLFATFFICPDDQNYTGPITHAPCNIVTYPSQNPFHFRLNEIQQILKFLPWKLTTIDHWKHPRGQQLIMFEKVTPCDDQPQDGKSSPK